MTLGMGDRLYSYTKEQMDQQDQFVKAMRILKPFLPLRQYEAIEKGIRDHQSEYYEKILLNLFKSVQGLPLPNGSGDGPGNNRKVYLRYYNIKSDAYVYVYSFGPGAMSPKELECLLIDKLHHRITSIIYTFWKLPGKPTVFSEYLLDIEFKPTTVGSVRWTHKVPMAEFYKYGGKPKRIPSFDLVRHFDETLFANKFKAMIPPPVFFESHQNALIGSMNYT